MHRLASDFLPPRSSSETTLSCLRFLDLAIFWIVLGLVTRCSLVPVRRTFSFFRFSRSSRAFRFATLFDLISSLCSALRAWYARFSALSRTRCSSGVGFRDATTAEAGLLPAAARHAPRDDAVVSGLPEGGRLRGVQQGGHGAELRRPGRVAVEVHGVLGLLAALSLAALAAEALVEVAEVEVRRHGG
jgi:hypothetical protein